MKTETWFTVLCNAISTRQYKREQRARLALKNYKGIKWAWLKVWVESKNQMTEANYKRKDHFGIRVENDEFALMYRKAHRRAKIASIHLDGSNDPSGLISTSEFNGAEWIDTTKREKQKSLKNWYAEGEALRNKEPNPIYVSMKRMMYG